MIQIQGTKINAHGIQMRELGDFIYYEGPLLSLYVDENKPNRFYLIKWLDCNHVYNRWLIAEVSEDNLLKFYQQKVSLKQLISRNPRCYVVDKDNDLVEQEIVKCAGDSLPQDYYPTEQSFFSADRYDEFAIQFLSELERKSLLNERIAHLINQKKQDYQDVQINIKQNDQYKTDQYVDLQNNQKDSSYAL